MKLRFYLNNTEVEYEIRPDEYLAHALRRNGVLSVRMGCNEDICGSCTVLVDEKPVVSKIINLEPYSKTNIQLSDVASRQIEVPNISFQIMEFK